MNRVAKIEQVRNGYIVSTSSGLMGEMKVYNTYGEVVDALRFYFDEKEAEG